MKMLSRRMLLASTVLLPVVGCTSQQVSQAVTDIGLIASGIQAEAPALTALGVPAGTLAQINTYLTALQAAGAAVAASGVATTVSVQSVTSAVNGIVAAVSGVISLPASTANTLAAAEALLPILATAVGLAGTPAKAVKGVAPLTPEAARLVLAAKIKT